MKLTLKDANRRLRERTKGRLKVLSFTKLHAEVIFECKLHGSFIAKAVNMLSNPGNCPECSKAPRFAMSEVRQRCKEIHGNRLTITDYIGMNVKATFICTKHGEFKAKPANVLHVGSGCPVCWSERRGPMMRKSHEQYLLDVFKKHKDTITVAGRYSRAFDKIAHRCSKGHTWTARPNDILSGYGCPFCDTSSYRRRVVTIAGKDFTLQGVEPFALNLLVARFGVDEVSNKVPHFQYVWKKIKRKYIPDFIVGTNLIVEVKGPSTLGVYSPRLFEIVKAKRKSVVKEGYLYHLMVHTTSGRRIELPKNWFNLTHKQLVDSLKGQKL